MTPQKLRQLESSLNGMARKVYDHIPASEPASLHAISTFMWKSGLKPSFDVLEACVGHCHDVGLVKREAAGYVRVQARPEEPRQPKEETVAQPLPITIPPAKAPTAFDRLTTLATRLRDAAKEAEDIALLVEQQMADSGKAAERLRQLQALLREEA